MPREHGCGLDIYVNFLCLFISINYDHFNQYLEAFRTVILCALQVDIP